MAVWSTGHIPRLCVICDAEVCARAGWTIPDYAAACVDAGARFVQIRAKRAGSGELLDLAETVLQRLSGADVLVVVNDRPDIARIAGVGVHVGQDDLPAAAARAIVGASSCVGLSTHTEDQVSRALAQPIDYVAVGPVYTTVTKDTGYEAIGLSRVTAAAAHGLPVVAIGGISLSNAEDVVRAGAQSVAVISDLLVGGNPAARVRAYLNRL